MKILLLGAKGQVGRAIEKRFCPNTNLLATTIDITDYKAVETSIRSLRPDAIINCAAYTRVDDAETNKDKAFAVNAVAPNYIANYAKKYNALVVHYSTDYVFDGSGYTPWTEEDVPAPLNTYGSTKWEGDKQIINSGCKYLILRTSWVYNMDGHNFINSILKQANEKNDISVISDQIGVPTSADFLADVTYKMVKASLENENLLGLYNISPKGETSCADYARFIIEKSGLSASIQIKPILSKDYPQRAQRPLNSRLNTDKLQKNFGINPPDWKQDVLNVIKTKLNG